MHLSTAVRGAARLEGRPEVTGFLDELSCNSQTRPAGRKELKLTKTQEAQQGYDLLHWCDRLSLILCRQEIPEMGRAVEIYHGPGGGPTHSLAQPEASGPVLIKPWPFREKAFSVSVEASVLNQLQFKDDAELAEALRAAPIETLRWELRAK